MESKILNELMNPTVEPTTLRCPAHGDYPGEIRRFLSREIRTPCPVCAAEQAEAERRAAEARAAEARRRERAARYRAAGLPLRFWERDFEGYRARTPEQRKALVTVRRYAERFAALAERGTCLLLCGGPGTGKTHLAVALAKRLLEDGHDVRYAGARLMDRLRENGGVVVPFTWASERGLRAAA